MSSAILLPQWQSISASQLRPYLTGSAKARVPPRPFCPRSLIFLGYASRSCSDQPKFAFPLRRLNFSIAFAHYPHPRDHFC
nr:putative integron gene cassette protein [uncultured bacterium]